jgi:ribose 5-phosphate isomerase B
MQIALCSDEPYPVHATVRALVAARGHEVVAYGALASSNAEPWVDVAEQAALAIVSGVCTEGIFFCWSGTGIAMAANKLPGIRAALCVDPGSARAARVWNHANVLCLSNRLLSEDMAKEVLEAWFETPMAEQGLDGAQRLQALDERWRRSP